MNSSVLSFVRYAGSGLQSYARVTAQPQQPYHMSDTGHSRYQGQFQLHSSDPTSNWLPVCKFPPCQNPVHYEPDVGLFEYCSPTCRDSDLLEEDKIKLKRDLQKLAKGLRASSKGSASSTPSPRESGVRSPKGMKLTDSCSSSSSLYLGVMRGGASPPQTPRYKAILVQDFLFPRHF